MLKKKKYQATLVKELQDHPPITPVATGSKMKNISKLKEEEKNIFDLVVRNFYASVSPRPEFEIVDTKFSIGDLTFNERHAETNIENEFKLIEHNIKNLYKLKLSKYKFKEGDPFYIKSVKLQKWQKAPEEYISESELIKKMETYGIGTDGTIPKYVKKIESKGFVITEVMNGYRRLRPTAFGETVAELYLGIDEGLIKPDVRAFIEECCNKIVHNDMSPEVVKERVFEIFRDKLNNVSANFNRLALTKEKLDQKFVEKQNKIAKEYLLEQKRKDLREDYLLKEIVLKAPKSNSK